MSTLDTGSARSRLNIYGQRIIWVVYHEALQRTSHKLLPTLSSVIGRLLLIAAKLIYYQVDVISTGCYTMMSILLYGTFILNLLPTSYLIKTVSLSDVAIASVCKYSGIRLLQSTYLIMLVLFL